MRCGAEQGTKNLVDAAKKTGAKQVVMLSSLLTNGAAKGQGTNPNFLFLNLFGGVLNKKHEVKLTQPTAGCFVPAACSCQHPLCQQSVSLAAGCAKPF